MNDKRHRAAPTGPIPAGCAATRLTPKRQQTLVPGLVVLSPLSGILGLPSVFALMVVLITGQLLIGRSSFWLPQWMLRRKASCGKFDNAIRFLYRLAYFIDRT